MQVNASKWVRMFELRKPIAGCFDELWRTIGRLTAPRPFSADVVDELLLVMALVPLLFTDLRLEISPQTIISDASPTGGGVCASKHLTDAGTLRASGVGKSCSTCRRPARGAELV